MPPSELLEHGDAQTLTLLEERNPKIHALDNTTEGSTQIENMLQDLVKL